MTYLVDLEKKIANAKVSSQHNSDLLNTQVNGIKLTQNNIMNTNVTLIEYLVNRCFVT